MERQPIRDEQGLQMFTENWCYPAKLSLKGWKLANIGKSLKQQHLPAQTCACTHTECTAHSEKL